MTTSFGATPPGIAGTHFGGSGIGLLGSLVPASGLDGPGYLYADLSLPADSGKEARGPITRWPGGTLTVYEDSSFSYVGTSDYALYLLYVDGVAATDDIGYGAGIGRFELGVGDSDISGSLVVDDVAVDGVLTGAVDSILGGDVSLADVVAAGTMTGESGGTSCSNWECVLGNGKTAGQNIVEIHAMLTALTPEAIADAVWSKVLS